jgi:very-short-patch-repair endonuclease
VQVGPIPVTSVARTLLGLTALVPEVPEERVRTAISVAVRDGQASDAWPWWRLERLRCRGRNGVTVLERILRRRASLGPTESWLEQRFLDLLVEHGLPTPKVQRRVRRAGSVVARVDAAYESIRLAIELEGHAHHSTPEDRTRDERRRNRLTLAGWTVMVFTNDQVVREPLEVVATVRAALAARHAS